MDDQSCTNALPDEPATSLKIRSLETGANREYEYEADAQLLWITDFDPAMRCTQKRRFTITWNPIPQIREKAVAHGGVDA